MFIHASNGEKMAEIDQEMRVIVKNKVAPFFPDMV